VTDAADGRVVVSFPKSGRTWLRVILDALEVSCRYTHDGSRHADAHHFDAMRCAGPGYDGARVVFLYRDPRDTAVSGYFQAAKRLGNFNGDIGEFIRSPHHGIEKIVRFNSAWLDPPRPNVHYLTYEAMTQDAIAEIKAVCEFLGTPRNDEQIARAVEQASFNAMKKKEASGAFADAYGSRLTPGQTHDAESFKVRRGKVGGYVDYLSADDIAYADEVMARLGYRPQSEGATRLRSPAPG
jgi:hypothetical protein